MYNKIAQKQDHRGDVRDAPKFRSKKVANSIYLMRKETPKNLDKKDEKRKKKKSSRRKISRNPRQRQDKSNSIEAVQNSVNMSNSINNDQIYHLPATSNSNGIKS